MFIALTYPEVGLGTAKLFVGMAGNDVKLTTVGLHVTTLNNYFTLLHLL